MWISRTVECCCRLGALLRRMNRDGRIRLLRCPPSFDESRCKGRPLRRREIFYAGAIKTPTHVSPDPSRASHPGRCRRRRTWTARVGEIRLDSSLASSRSLVAEGCWASCAFRSACGGERARANGGAGTGGSYGGGFAAALAAAPQQVDSVSRHHEFATRCRLASASLRVDGPAGVLWEAFFLVAARKQTALAPRLLTIHTR